MQIRRQEILTGLLVLISVAAVTGVLLMLGAPGVFSPVHTFYIHFDNAGGIKPGGPVLLAGRKIGQVTKLYSPVPRNARPRPELEALVEVQVQQSAKIYREVRIMMQQFGMLGEYVIDFTSGEEASGLAQDRDHFVGDRAGDLTEAATKMLQMVDPVAKEAKQTLEELRGTADNLKRLTNEGSDFDLATERMRILGDNLVNLSRENGPIDQSIQHFKNTTANLEKISGDLLQENTIQITLQKFQNTAERLETVGQNLDAAVEDVAPELTEIARNAVDLTATLKRQPWRLIWPTTKRYPEDEKNPPVVRVKKQGLKREPPIRRAIPVR